MCARGGDCPWVANREREREDVDGDMRIVVSGELPLDNSSCVDGGSRVSPPMFVPSTFLSEETSEVPHRILMSLGLVALKQEASTTLTRKVKVHAYRPHMQLAAPPSRLLFAPYALPRAVCARLTFLGRTECMCSWCISFFAVSLTFLSCCLTIYCYLKFSSRSSRCSWYLGPLAN